MEEQAVDIAKQVGTALAAFFTAWLGLVKPLDKKPRKAMITPEDLNDLRAQAVAVAKQQQEISDRLARLEERAADTREKIHEACQDLKSVQEKLGRMVTDEEFAAYVQSTNSEVRSLSERLGRATGAIEAWSRG